MNQLILLAVVGIFLGCQLVHAETNLIPPAATEFRVTTKIFAGKDEQPSAEHLLIFTDGLVYDLPQAGDSVVTVYDPRRSRVILMDRATQVRTMISTDELIKMTAELRTLAADEKSQTRLGLNAEILPMVIDPKSGEAAPVELSDADPAIASDGFMTSYGDASYEVRTQTPRQPAVATAYGQFADWALRLNVARRMGSPPFARMSLNESITAAGLIPKETRLTIRRGLLSDRYRSTHTLIERISEADRKQINEVGGMLVLYQEVSWDQFP